MRKRTNAKQKLKMVTSLFLCAASLFSCVGLTLAWFAFNDNVSGNGIGVGADNPTDLWGYEFYTADAKADGYVFKLAKEQGAASLGEYDLLEDKYRLLLKLYFKENVTSVTASAVTSTTYFLGDGEDDHKLVAELDSTGATLINPLSSVVSFREAAASELQYDSAAKAYTWTKPTEETYKTLVADGKIPASGTAEICSNYDISGAAGTYTDGEGVEHESRIMYILFSYDADLISEVFSANIGNPVLEKENAKVPFACDFHIALETVLA